MCANEQFRKEQPGDVLNRRQMGLPSAVQTCFPGRDSVEPLPLDDRGDDARAPWQDEPLGW